MNRLVPRRYLIGRMLDVCFVKNFTHIDDQILKRASEKTYP
jgi:cysteinyl-tRNA synthetase